MTDSSTNIEAQSIEPPVSVKGIVKGKIATSLKERTRTLSQIPEDQRWLTSKDWVGVLKMLDVLDQAPGSDTINHPHLNMIHWHWYHMPDQGISMPFPKQDGTESESQRQIVASVNWVLRLGKEVNPKTILEFPSIEGRSNNHATSTFLEKDDPGWSSEVLEVSRLLEPKAKDGRGLGFGLTEENYTKLDSPRKKIIAFLLLRERVSNLMAGVISDILLSSAHRGKITNVHELLSNAAEGDDLRPVIKALLQTKLGEKSIIDWLASVYNNPLLTHTSDVYFSGGNKVREEFVEKAEDILKKDDPNKKIAYEITAQSNVLRRLADEGVFDLERNVVERAEALAGREKALTPLEKYRQSRDELQRTLAEIEKVSSEQRTSEQIDKFAEKVAAQYASCAKALESLVVYAQERLTSGQTKINDQKAVSSNMGLLEGMSQRFAQAKLLREVD